MPGALELIGDVGGSSSRWALLFDDGSVQRFGTEKKRLIGFNPAVGASKGFEKEVGGALRKALSLAGQPGIITVYGAGCGSPERAARMKAVVAGMLGNRYVHVGTDLHGAARGTLGSRSGLVLILGTGMNAGGYHRGRLVASMPSLGWILGDEGSGADIGKHLLYDAMHGRVPKEVMRSVFGRTRIGRDEMMMVLAAERPNAELAGLAWRLGQRARTIYTDALLSSRFTALASVLDMYFADRKAQPMHAVGGIAFTFRSELARALRARGFDLVDAVADPMDGLIAWHQEVLGRPKSRAAKRLR